MGAAHAVPKAGFPAMRYRRLAQEALPGSATGLIAPRLSVGVADVVQGGLAGPEELVSGASRASVVSTVGASRPSARQPGVWGWCAGCHVAGKALVLDKSDL